MAQGLARCLISQIGLFPGLGSLAARKKRIASIRQQARLWGLHFQPARGLIPYIAKAVRLSGANQSKISGANRECFITDLDCQAAIYDIKSFLKGMQMRGDNTYNVKKANACT